MPVQALEEVGEVGEEDLFAGGFQAAAAERGAGGGLGGEAAYQAGQLPPRQVAGEQVAQADAVFTAEVCLYGWSVVADQLAEAPDSPGSSPEWRR
ncbi:hypothetical protein [Streptomyces albireticuli]|uniref:hypothetical protein n=1 Tax=Streptomyces albireticuli TaxID=1940 RepID=UPI00117D14E0|nr:hypothetical protein [Streptomyces albireticuli]MCD9196079.1 hypothetical protein [Streptomyces albireticuli]